MTSTSFHYPFLKVCILYPESYKFSTQATSWAGVVSMKKMLEKFKKLKWLLMLDWEFLQMAFCQHWTPFPGCFTRCFDWVWVLWYRCGWSEVSLICREELLDYWRSNWKVWNLCLDKSSDDIFQLKHDHPYYFQCQLQMYVTQRGYCDFVVWTSDTLHVQWITQIMY